MGVTPSAISIMCSLSFAFGGFINLCMYPLLFQFGYEKGKIWGFYLPITLIAIIFGIIGAVSNTEKVMPKILSWLVYWSQNTLFVCTIMLAIGVALMYISYRLSLFLYEKRDV
ncbi:hypothetical protein FACS1894132_09170 [Clostridia bacterium]|nr:hypothetical protein FACS1894132_09170 [Clostridia bacterium]